MKMVVSSIETNLMGKIRRVLNDPDLVIIMSMAMGFYHVRGL